MNLKNIHLSKIISISFLIVSISLTLYFIIFPGRGFFGEANSADMTDTIMWSNAMIEGKGIFDKDFYYAAFLPVGGSLLMLPFIPLFGLSITTHIIGMVWFFLILIISIYFLGKKLDFKIQGLSFLTCSLLSIFALSYKLREMFYGHIIYYSLGFLFIIIGLTLIINYEEKSKDLSIKEIEIKKFIKICWPLALFSFLVALDGLQIISIVTVPLLAAIIIPLLFNKEKLTSESNIKKIVEICIISLSTLIGFIFLFILKIGTSTSGYAEAYSLLSPPDKWFSNFSKFMSSWITLFGYTNPIKMNASAIIQIIILAFSIFILIIPFVMILFYNKFSLKLKYVLISNFGVFGVIMFGFVFGNLSAANWRLIPILAINSFTTICFIKFIYENYEVKRYSVILAIPFVLIFFIGSSNLIIDPNYKQDSTYFKLASFLEEKELNYGYATFWNANSITVISSNKVKTRVINDLNKANQEITKRYYQSSSNWYTVENRNYFVLLTENEYNSLNTLQKDIASDTYTFNNYYILVYENNPIK